MGESGRPHSPADIKEGFGGVTASQGSVGAVLFRQGLFNHLDPAPARSGTPCKQRQARGRTARHAVVHLDDLNLDENQRHGHALCQSMLHRMPVSPLRG